MNEVDKLIRHINKDELGNEIINIMNNMAASSVRLKHALTAGSSSKETELKEQLHKAKTIVTGILLAIDDVEAIIEGVEKLNLSEELVDDSG